MLWPVAPCIKLFRVEVGDDTIDEVKCPREARNFIIGSAIVPRDYDPPNLYFHNRDC
jgi:hypothetical protein